MLRNILLGSLVALSFVVVSVDASNDENTTGKCGAGKCGGMQKSTLGEKPIL